MNKKVSVWISALVAMAIVGVQLAMADTYSFHDGFDGALADGNYTFVNRSVSNNTYEFATVSDRSMIVLYNLPSGSNPPLHNQFETSTLLVRSFPSDFNASEINITIVHDVSLQTTFDQQTGLGFFNGSGASADTYSPNIECTSGRTSESYDSFYGTNWSSALFVNREDYPSSFGDSGTGDNWENHVLRLQLKLNANGSYHVSCHYTNLGGLAGNASWYHFGEDKEADVAASYLTELYMGILVTPTLLNSNGPVFPGYFDDFYVDAVGSYLAEEEEAVFGDIDVDLVNPSDNAALTAHSVVFSWSLNVSAANCTLNLNNVSNASTDALSISRYIADTELMTWRVNCTTDAVSGSSETRQFSVNTTHYTDDAGIAVSLISPANASVLTDHNVSFDYSSNVSSNCTLLLDGANNVTQESGTPFGRYVADTPLMMWRVDCSSTYAGGSSETWQFKMNTTAPTTDIVEAEVCPKGFDLGDAGIIALVTIGILLVSLLYIGASLKDLGR